MQAYCQGITKEEFVSEVKLHYKLDNFIKSTYDQGDKGCAVGCSIKSINKLKALNIRCSDHKAFETYLGIPEWLARLEDVIFENLPLKRAKIWPVKFSEAINEKSNLDKIRTPYIIYILKENIKVQKKQLSLINSNEIQAIIKDVISVNKNMIAAQESGDKTLINLAAARSAAWSAAAAAESAAWSAAESAAWSARSAAESAAWSAAWSAAESAAFGKYANKLLQLIKDCK